MKRPLPSIEVRKDIFLTIYLILSSSPIKMIPKALDNDKTYAMKKGEGMRNTLKVARLKTFRIEKIASTSNPALHDIELTL